MNLVRPDAVERVAILGSGAIGASWAAYFLAHGLAVNIWDPAPGFEARCRASSRGRPRSAACFIKHISDTSTSS